MFPNSCFSAPKVSGNVVSKGEFYWSHYWHFVSSAEKLPELSIHAFDLTSRRDCPKLTYKEMNSIVMMLRKEEWGRDGDNALPHAFPLSYLLSSPPYSLSLPSPSLSPSNRYHFSRFLVPGLSTAKGLALAFEAGSSSVSDFSLAILRLNEQGFLGKLTRKWWDDTYNCPVEKTTSE